MKPFVTIDIISLLLFFVLHFADKFIFSYIENEKFACVYMT